MAIKPRFGDERESIPTPQCDELDRLRKYFKQPASPAYNDCLRLARKLERELIVAHAWDLEN